MTRSTLFRLNRVVHHFAIAAWVGALAAFVIAAINVFGVTPHFHPTIHLAPFDNPVFAAHTTDILAGGIVIHILWMLAYLQFACAGILLLTCLLDATVFADHLRGGRRSWPHLTRLGLVAGIVVILLTTHVWIMPRMDALRGKMYRPQLSAAVREATRDRFDLWHAVSEKITTVQVGMLLLTLFLSPFVTREISARHRQETAEDG